MRYWFTRAENEGHSKAGECVGENFGRLSAQAKVQRCRRHRLFSDCFQRLGNGSARPNDIDSSFPQPILHKKRDQRFVFDNQNMKSLQAALSVGLFTRSHSACRKGPRVMSILRRFEKTQMWHRPPTIGRHHCSLGARVFCYF